MSEYNNPLIHLHNESVHVRNHAVESVALCQGYLKNPSNYGVTDHTIMSSAVEYQAYANSIEKEIAAFPVKAARAALTTMGLLHNAMYAERHLRQLKPELARDITEQMAREAYVFRKTGDYVDTVIRVHEFTAAHDSRYRPVCNVAVEVEGPLKAILQAEEEARACPREMFGEAKGPDTLAYIHSAIGVSRLNFVSVLNRANVDALSYSNSLINRAVSTDEAVRLGYVRKKEASLSGHFVQQALGLAQKVVNTQTGLIGTLAATFEMAENHLGIIPLGDFKARRYTTVPIVSTFAKLTA